MKFTSFSVFSSLSFLFFGSKRVFGSSSSTTCDDSYECEDTSIDTTNADCYGYYACYAADIDSTNHYNYGAYASYEADVEATTSYSYGLQSAYYADMELTTLYAYGYLSAQYADIEPKSSKLTLDLYGYYAGYYADVYCYSGDTCYIYCGDSYGCDELKYYCYSGATCYYDCDGDDTCPTLYSGVESETASMGEISQTQATEYKDMTDDEITGKKHENKQIKLNKIAIEKETGMMDKELYDKIMALPRQTQDENKLLLNSLAAAIPHNNENIFDKIKHSGYAPVIYGCVGASIMALVGIITAAVISRTKNDYQYQPIV